MRSNTSASPPNGPAAAALAQLATVNGWTAADASTISGPTAGLPDALVPAAELVLGRYVGELLGGALHLDGERSRLRCMSREK
jgi:hypothetical protein